MTMNTITHAAVRRDLRRFGEALWSFAEGDAARAKALGAAWRNFESQLTHHHESEERLFFPAMEELGVGSDLIAQLDAEHGRMADALAAATASMRALAGSPTGKSAAVARSALVDLTEAVDRHFEHEERDLEPLFAANAEAEPLKRASAQVRREQSPASAGVFLAWLLDGAEPAVRKDLARYIPAPVLFVLSRFLGRSYRRGPAAAWR